MRSAASCRAFSIATRKYLGLSPAGPWRVSTHAQRLGFDVSELRALNQEEQVELPGGTGCMSTDAIARKLIEGRNSMQIACRLNLNLQAFEGHAGLLAHDAVWGAPTRGASSRWELHATFA